ncbi:MAG TPA: FeoB-associated Cys-rich membrane protein [Cytophagaceae bacterium]
MIQEILVGLIFLAAIFYLGRMVYRQFASKEAGCSSGCGGCSKIDLQKIEEQIRKSQTQQK